MSKRMDNDIEEASRAVIKMQAGVLALVFSVLCGFGLFAMTVWLVVKGGPRVGSHLQLLNNYFPGYSVTWVGSIVGLFYGALFGGIIGYVIGKIYNGVMILRHR
jgi:hypothetical protein